MIGVLIGAGVGLVAGAGIGFLLAALFKGGYIAELEQQVDELGERCDRYVGELDALVEATRPVAGCYLCQLGDPHAVHQTAAMVHAIAEDSWAAEGLRTAGEPMKAPERADMGASVGAPTPGKGTGVDVPPVPTPEPWRPGFDANPTILLGPGETYEQWYAAYAERLDSWCPGWWDDLPKTVAPSLRRLAEERRAETYAQNELDHDRIPTREGFEERPFRPNRSGMAIYPRQDGEAR